MTIQEAIREVEQTIEGGRALEKENGNALPGRDRYMDLLETLLAARERAQLRTLTEYDELIEESKQLTVETVDRAAACVEDAITHLVCNDMCLMVDGIERLGMVFEPALHTALAALRKVQADLLTMGEDATERGARVHVVQMKVNGPEDKEKIMEMVKGDLEKIFAEQEAK